MPNQTPNGPDTALISGAETGLVWRDERTPVSPQFNDIYFSVDGGLEEARHVFLAGCGLPALWHQHFAPNRPNVFTIGETGFGTGLNFLASCALWHQERCNLPSDAWLEYLSVELYPLARDDLARAVRCWPELLPFSEALLAVYPAPVLGFHRVVLPQYRVRLTLMIGDAAEMLSQCATGGTTGGMTGVDAWFLDGFAPARNPEMWRPAVFSALGRLSHHGTRLSSFTAARMVRDGLSAVGFSVERTKGFGRKRDMIQAVFQGGGFQGDAGPSMPDRRLRRVAVIGGGIAGASLAHILTLRGCSVRVFDRAHQPAQGASGNPVGMVMPKLQLGMARSARFHRAAFRFGHHIMRMAGDDVAPTGGVLQLATDAAAAHRAQRLAAEPFVTTAEAMFLSADAASDQAGIRLHHPALWLSLAGWGRPAQIVQTFLQPAEWVGGWSGSTADIDALRADHDHVILATGMDHVVHPLLSGLPLRPRKGQITMIAPNPVLAGLQCCVTAGRYLSPLIDGAHVLGATFDPHDMAVPLCADMAADQHNLAQIGAFIPEITACDVEIIGHRVGVRATTPDHVPIVGRINDDVSVMTGLGSSGLTTAWLCAEILATHLLGGTMPVEADIVANLTPQRFLAC